jgi:hypothetical protein
MKHCWLTFIIIFLGVLAAPAQQPPVIHQSGGINEWRFTRPVNYADCDFIALVKYAGITVSVPQYTYEYDGTAHTPATVKLGDRVLSLENGDYRYSDNVNAGKVSVYVRKGGGEAEFADVFEIVQKEVRIVWTNTYLECDGTEQQPDAAVTGLEDGDQCTISVSGAQIMPGTYTAAADIEIAGNYRISGDMTTSFTIAPRTVTVTADSKSKTYGDPDPALTYTVSGLLDGDVVSGELTRAPGEDAGGYVINQGTLAASAGYYKLVYNSANLTINPFDNFALIWGNTDFVYNGEQQAPAVRVDGIKDGDECEVIVKGAQTDAGTYTATASLSNRNYKLPANYQTEFTIAKADPVVVPPTPVDGLVFDNHRHTLITPGSASSGTMLYRLTDGNCSETLPEGVAVGFYDVYYYVEGNKNFNSTAEQSVRAVIAPTDLPVVDADKMECILSAEHFCNGKAKLVFLILAGSADNYSITFDSPEIQAQTGTITDDGVLEFSVPKTLRLGTYKATIVFSDNEGRASEAYPFEFEVRYIGELIKRLYYNTLCADNHEHLYTSFRWRNNGNGLDGENNQYLHRDDLSGCYTAIVTLAADQSREVESCPYCIDNPVSKNAAASTVAVYPNPAISNSQLTIEILDYDPAADYLICINNNTGTLVKTITDAKQINTLSLPSGCYSGVLLSSGVKSGFKIIVK